MAAIGFETFVYRKRNFLYSFVRHRFFLLCKQSMVRVQSPEGIKRIEISPNASLKEFFDNVQQVLKVDGFGLFKERNFATELHSSPILQVGKCLKHGDVVYLKQIAGSSRRMSTTALGDIESVGLSGISSLPKILPQVEEDEVDRQLSKSNGLIKRERDSKLCHHNVNGCCLHCSPLEPYNEGYLKEQNIKHLSFHSYVRKQTSGIDRGKYVAFEDINCRIKPGCREHPPWPKGICSKCQPSAITLNRQIYRHVDNVMFENTSIVERFLNYWRTTGHQRLGFLYGRYDMHTDVPLGIRATVAAIYEPPQDSTRDSIKLLPDEGADDVDAMAKGLGLTKLGWIFTDLITDDPAAGTVKQLRGIDTHFLTAQECVTAGELQNKHPNPCKYSSSGYFGSKFVTVCVTGDQNKQVHMEGYGVSAQCMALVRDDCLIPTKDTPSLGYIRESTDKQYVPDVYYKEKDQYGNEVQRLARPLPVEYLLVDVPASTPLQPQYTFSQCDKRQPFPVENRYIDGHLQDFNALSTYLSQWGDAEFMEAVSDFHLLLYLYKMDMLPMREHMSSLLEAVRDQNTDLVYQFKKDELWKLLESLIHASSSGNGGTTNYPTTNTANASNAAGVDVTGTAGIGETWTCDHCTFINRAELSSCEMCSLPR